MTLSPSIMSLVRMAIDEDIGSGDLTSEALFPPSRKGTARILAKEDLIASGLSVCAGVFEKLDPGCRFQALIQEGDRARKGKILAKVSGTLRSLLAGERTALNFLRHLCGVATETNRYVDQLKNTGCILLDTRKTTPGMRSLEKAAVRAGGGTNHRFGLYDGVLIKDNHIATAGSISRAVQRARRRVGPMVKIEVEAATLVHVRQALSSGADMILLDNMSTSQVAKAVALVHGRIPLEASGNMNLASIRHYAKLGVNYISVGALTHSAKAADISMDVVSS
jgi:nicotinate-nucleotide pyrophosphorylase (carboxylating)